MSRLRLSHKPQAGLEHRFDKGAGKYAADHFSNDREPGIAPVRSAFSGHGQDCVGDAGTKIAGWVNGESRRAAQAQTDHPYDGAHQERSQRRRRSSGCDGFRKDRADDEHQHKRADHFADHV